MLHKFASIATRSLSVTIVALMGFFGSSCGKESRKGEMVNLIRVVTELRMAENEHKRGPLEQLRGLPCEASETCEARNACVEAFEHHVRGIELGAKLRDRLAQDGGGLDPEDQAALLIEMNLEVEEGRKAMPQCEQRVAELRRRHRL